MFKGKVVIITGSSQGIGKRTAELLGQRGAKLVINSRSTEKVQQVVDLLRSQGVEAIGIPGDISNFEFCLGMKHQIVEAFGRIDYLINNAALAAKGTLMDTHPDVFEQMMRVNELGSLYPTKAVLPELIKTKGGVLFISSLAGITGLPSYMAYSASKRSVVGIAESLKNELIEEGVFVGVNYPGFTENDENKKILLASGKTGFLKARTNVKVAPLDKTVKAIIRQIEKRAFRSYPGFYGRLAQFIYRMSPAFSLFILKVNRKKIMKMD